MKGIFLSLLSGTVLGAEDGYELLFTSSPQEVWPEQCLDTPGIPAGVVGNYLMGGPAVFEMGGKAFQQALDGFGKTYRFKIGGGKTCFGTRMMQTDFYNRSVKAGTIAHGGIFMETKPPRRCPLLNLKCNVDVIQDNNYVNNFPVQGASSNVLMISDTTVMVDFDMNTLQVTADHEWKDKIVPRILNITAGTAPLGSAHPLRDPAGRGGVVGVAMGAGPGGEFVDVYHLSPEKSDTRELLASYKTKTMRYFHSFGLTPHYAIMVHDYKFDLMGMAKTLGATIGGAIATGWEGIHVVQHNPAVGETEPTVFQTDPFFHVHTVNAFENATGIVMDLGVSHENTFSSTLTIDSMKNKDKRDAVGRLETKRLHLHMSGDAKGKVTEEVLSVPGASTEFTRINDAFQGKEYCVFYAVEWGHNGGGYASMAIVKTDICKKTRKYWYRESCYPSEPQFIATGSAEDDGVLIFTYLDGVRKVSRFVTVDASTMTELSSVDLPVLIPFTAHGEWYPASGQTAVVV